jgi:TolB protein
MRSVLLLLLFLSLSSAYAEEEAISVRLRTQKSLTPVYLDCLASEDSLFDTTYMEELEKILLFDLRHAGKIQVAARTASRQELSTKAFFGRLRDDASWQQEGIAYVIQWRVQGKQLKARLNGTVSGKSQGVDKLSLTGHLSEDRRSIHLLADALHKEMFGVNGIASTRILYCCKMRARPSPGEDAKDVSEVWECDYDGHNPHQITRGGLFCVTPSYVRSLPGSASGHAFYVSYQTGQPKIYLSPLYQWQPQRLTLLAGNQLMPVMSPSRDHIAFICDAAGTPDLFLQSFSPETGPVGKPMQIFTSNYATQASPSFSPDGQQIAFVSNKDGSPRIYVMDVPHSIQQMRAPKPTLISKRNRENTAPTWSPDGSKIAYSSKTDGTRQIWIYDLHKQEEWQLTDGNGHKENPSWAPDSQHLVFNSVNGHRCELYLVNLHQADVVRISQGPGEKRYPAWDPAWRP